MDLYRKCFRLNQDTTGFLYLIFSNQRLLNLKPIYKAKLKSVK